MSELQGMIAKFEVVEVDGPRPDQVPDGWIIFNAFRPLLGSLTKFDPDNLVLFPTARWEEPKGPHGWHFAAVDPDDIYALVSVLGNLRNRAVIVQYSD